MRQRATQSTDRGLAVLAHASIGFGLFGIGFWVGLLINLVIWLRSRRSSYVSIQAEQAGAYQLAVGVIFWVLVGIWVGGAAFFIWQGSSLGEGQLSVTQIFAGLWIALLPIIFIWHIGTLVYGLIGTLRVAAGSEFWYPVVGAWARRRAEADAIKRGLLPPA